MFLIATTMVGIWALAFVLTFPTWMRMPSALAFAGFNVGALYLLSTANDLSRALPSHEDRLPLVLPVIGLWLFLNILFLAFHPPRTLFAND